MIERTYEYRLYPTFKQQKQFDRIEDLTRALYNQMLKDRTDHFRNTGKWKKINAAPFVKKSLLMKELDTSIIGWTEGKLERAYMNFFHIRKRQTDRYRQEALQKRKSDPTYQLMDTDLVGYPRIKKKSSRESWNIGPANVLISNKRVNIPGLGNVKIRLHRPIPEQAAVQYYTILKKPSNHYFLLVHLQMPDPNTGTEIHKALGIALEPEKLIQCSDGRPVLFPHQTRAMKNKIARAYEKLSRKTPGSNQYEKQRIRLALLYEKRTNQRRDSLHKISADIVKRADFIAMEEPEVLRKKKKLLKKGVFETVHDEAWWTFSYYLKYKTLAAGKRFWKAPGAIPVRNACSVCGIIWDGSKRGSAWECPHCTVEMTSEMNAAKNLERFGLEYIAEQKALNQHI